MGLRHLLAEMRRLNVAIMCEEKPYKRFLISERLALVSREFIDYMSEKPSFLMRGKTPMGGLVEVLPKGWEP